MDFRVTTKLDSRKILSNVNSAAKYRAEYYRVIIDHEPLVRLQDRYFTDALKMFVNRFGGVPLPPGPRQPVRDYPMS